jgi:hypothetical protein
VAVAPTAPFKLGQDTHISVTQWQDQIQLVYHDICIGANITARAEFVEKGYISIPAPVQGLSIEAGSAVTITVWDADLDTDPLSTQVRLLDSVVCMHLGCTPPSLAKMDSCMQIWYDNQFCAKKVPDTFAVRSLWAIS